MSQFDEKTKAAAKEYAELISDAVADEYQDISAVEGLLELAFEGGRNSARDSLNLLAKAIQTLKTESVDCGEIIEILKSRGDWPI